MHCYYVWLPLVATMCLVAFLSIQKKDNPELLNFHEVIRGKSYQKLRFDFDTPMEFLEQALPDFKKPKLDAESQPSLSLLVTNYLTTWS